MIKGKFCFTCNTEKVFDDFNNHKGTKDGKQTICRVCEKKNKIKNKGKIKIRKDAYYQENKEHLKIKSNLRYQKNKEIIKKKTKVYNKSNRDKINKRESLRIKNNPSIRKSIQMASCLSGWIRNGRHSHSYVFDYMGLTKDECIKFIESRFKKGMNWNNYGKGGWTIDHITPKIMFDHTKEIEIKKCWSPSNIQLLWEKDNWLKGSRITLS